MINKLKTTKIDVIARKTARKLYYFLIDFFSEVLDRKYETYLIGKSKLIAHNLKNEEQFLDANKIINFAENIIDHIFSFLGINLAIVNLKNKDIIVNNSNIYKSQIINSLIDNNYRKINWHIDFNSKYMWEIDVWHKKIKFGVKNSDIKIPWEMSRFQFSYILFLAFKISKDKKYAIEFRNLCLDFMANNPPKFGVNWKSPMDVGIRSVNMIYTYNLFVNNGFEFDEKFQNIFAEYNYVSAKFVYQNPEFSGGQRGNHYLSNVCSLIIISQFYDTYESKKWFEFAINAFKKELEFQFLADGGNFEASMNYHFFATEMIFTTLFLLKKINKIEFQNLILKHEINSKLGLIKSFTLNNLQLKSENYYTVSQIGDNDSGFYLPIFMDINSEANGFDTQNKFGIKKLIDNFTEINFKKIEVNKFTKYNDFGIAIYKGNNFHFDIRCGSVGQYGKGGHAHNDQLSITLSVEGNEFIVDSGTYIYTSFPELRNKFRSTKMHNTLILENNEQNPISDNFSDLFWMSDNSKAKIIKAEKNIFSGIHYAYPKEHKREIKIEDNKIYGKDLCVIEMPKQARFHLHPNVDIKLINENEVLAEINGTTVAISSVDADIRIEDSNYSKEYGVIEKSKVIILESVNFEITWMIEIKK